MIRIASRAAPLAVALGSLFAQERQNLLLLIADDVGVDRVGAYGLHPTPPKTPNIDALAQQGLLFENCWANPFCSATRATVLTGRYAFRTGIGKIMTSATEGPGLLASEWTLPDVLAAGTEGAYFSACLGKWHLRGENQSLEHPGECGFDRFAGSMNNLGEKGGSYYDWSKVVDGEQTRSHTYATTDTVDDALVLVEELGDRPWLLWVAFHAAHVPFHAPPDDLHDVELDGNPHKNPVPYFKAMVQALDAEIGRLLTGIPPEVLARTTVVFLGDNGTTKEACEPPFGRRGKSSLHEGGVRVPLIVRGPSVKERGTACAALVNSTDLFATLAELAGVDARATVPGDVALDSLSLVPYLTDPDRVALREVVFAEKFDPPHDAPKELLDRAMRGTRFKLIRNLISGREKLYDLSADPFELDNLMKHEELDDEQRAAYEDLSARIVALAATDLRRGEADEKD